jgi:nitrite reductase/ring-hydroxylating ferredoxin subunit
MNVEGSGYVKCDLLIEQFNPQTGETLAGGWQVKAAQGWFDRLL